MGLQNTLPSEPTVMYLLGTVTLGILGLCVWVVKYMFTRFAEGQDKIVSELQALRTCIMETCAKHRDVQ